MQTISPLSIISPEVDFFKSSYIFPALENKRSSEAEDAGAARNCLAIYSPPLQNILIIPGKILERYLRHP
jgi:hypothetical protein